MNKRQKKKQFKKRYNELFNSLSCEQWDQISISFYNGLLQGVWESFNIESPSKTICAFSGTIPDNFIGQLQILPYAEQVRNGILQMQKYTATNEFVILISPEICQGGFKLYGYDVIAHPMLDGDKIYIINKAELDKYMCSIDFTC